MSAHPIPSADEIERIRSTFSAFFPYVPPKKRRRPKARGRFLVTATRTALRNAWDLGHRGVIESALEGAIEEGATLPRLPNGDRVWLVDGLAVRTRLLDEPTADGRHRLLIVGVEPHYRQSKAR